MREAAAKLGARVAPCEGFARGGEGALDLARAVCEVVDATDADPPKPKYVYELGDAAEDKIRKLAKTIYGARDVTFMTAAAEKDLEARARPPARRAPDLHGKDAALAERRPHRRRAAARTCVITVRGVVFSAGAGFLVPLTGEMMTMPGLPKVPAARGVKLQGNGKIKGLMQND